MVPAIWLMACLERVTGEDIPLDPRFYQTPEGQASAEGGNGEADGPPEAEAGAPGGDPNGAPDGPPQPGGEKPYADITGDKITVSGTITPMDAALPVRIDVSEPDSSVEGGLSRKGAIQLEAGITTFSLEVPATVTNLQLQVFQDPDKDGPGESDPFAEAKLSLSGSSPEPISLVLAIQKRGDPNGGGGGQSTGEFPYAGVEGEKVKVSGTISAPGELPIRIDVVEPDANAPGGLKRQGAIQLNPGTTTFSLDIPITVTTVMFQAFQDPDKDGPSENDPYAEQRLSLNGSTPPESVVLNLVVGARGKPDGGGGGGGGGDGAPTGSPPPEQLSFPEGSKVVFAGKIEGGPTEVVLDIFRADGAGGGARSFVGKQRVKGAEFRIEFPEDFGAIEIEAYEDKTGDGRSGDDRTAPTLPFTIGSSDQNSILIKFATE